MSGNDKSGLEDKYVFIYLGNILPFGYCLKSIFWLLIKNICISIKFTYWKNIMRKYMHPKQSSPC